MNSIPLVNVAGRSARSVEKHLVFYFFLPFLYFLFWFLLRLVSIIPMISRLRSLFFLPPSDWLQMNSVESHRNSHLRLCMSHGIT